MEAVVLLSGGQDSTTCLYWALDRYDEVGAVSFDYGQRHGVELDCATKTVQRNSLPWEVYDIPALAQLGQASLTNESIPNPQDADATIAGRNIFAEDRGLPPSYVPGRNLLFFTLAAAHAAKMGATRIVTGICGQDRAGYPDCRVEFADAMEDTIRIGFDWPKFKIDAPLLDRTKADTWRLADELGVLDRIVLDTHTCYEGVHESPPAPWGYGCGKCPACVERVRGYDEYMAAKNRERFPAAHK